jgi:stage II sporulation protein P
MLKKLLVITLSLTLLWTMMGGAPCQAHEEMPLGQYFTLVDENNNIIHQTAMRVHEGDEYISADNARYKVMEIQGDIAICAYQGEERMPVVSFDSQRQAWVFKGQEIAVLSGEKKPTVAVYHTHSDESYLPSDGTESRAGNGGIYDVGEAFVDELKRLGFNVEYNKNNHNPHDINAYNRSRKTAVTLIKKESPDVVVDIHRDAVPPDVYQAEVEGKEVTKIKLVVGKQNPNMKTNLEFAKQIKAVMDKQSPGMSNGIFMGKGDYNQDLSPRAILIEVGSHTNDKDSAAKGVKLFANTMQSVLAGNSGQNQDPAAKPLSQDNQGAFTNVLILLVVLSAAAGGFYLLNKGSGSKGSGRS